jgi:hypothetical protein
MAESGKIAPNVSIRIDRLRIHLKGVDETTARAAMTGIGPQLARYFGEQGGQAVSLAGYSADKVNIPPIAHTSRDPASLRAVTAQAIAGAILATPGSKGGTS